MLRFLSTVRKEMITLSRDRSGMAVLFLMPLVLLILMALIQDAPFRDYQELRIPLLLINDDKGELGQKISAGLHSSNIFEVTDFAKGEEEAQKLIENSTYEIGIVIPENASAQLEGRVDQFVNETMGSLGLNEEYVPDTTSFMATIKVFFAPDIKKSFRNVVFSSIRHVSAKVETQQMLSAFKQIVDSEGTDTTKQEWKEFMEFKEVKPASTLPDYQLTSVQHNVPAWTLFGMFFIVISLAGSMIKERNEGSYLRLRTMPGSYNTIMAGKLTTYLGVCLVQCILMILTGIFLLPLFDLPPLVIGDNWPVILVTAICSGLAACGYGVLVGTFFNTHQQASTFGALSVLMLAALGGIWVPVYVMPKVVRFLAEFSPLYWGLNAFQTVFLAKGTISDILIYLLKLLAFFVVTFTLAGLVDRYKNRN